MNIPALIFAVVAVVLFAAAARPVPSRVGLLPLGLACLTVSWALQVVIVGGSRWTVT